MKKLLSVSIIAVACAFLSMSVACGTADKSNNDQSSHKSELVGNGLISQSVKWIGRTEYDIQKSAVNCYYTATGFEVRFIGTKLDVTFYAENTDSDKNRPYFIAGIDGYATSAGKRFALTKSTSTVTVAENLDGAKAHTITVLKASEPENSFTSIVKIVTDGDFIKPSKSTALKFQILGGSGISGHGCLGQAGEEWTTKNSSSLSAFGYLAAQAFGAECQFVSNSGMGLKWGYRGVENLVNAYEAVGLIAKYKSDGSTVSVNATQTKWDHSSWVPDVVIVNIGGNDWTSHISALKENTNARRDAENAFKQSVKTLLDRIYGLYPSAYVVWTCNSKFSGNGALAKNAIDELAYRTQISVVEIDNSKNGADNHADTQTHIKNAATVVSAIELFGFKRS